ncbi:MAG: beta-aspartyl-peptidase [Acidobacteria bacterium]|nr:beta-aspartyl-peptidase [Acidobacteriota bacterium]
MIELLKNADVYAPEPLGLRHLAVCGGRILWLGETLPEIPRELLGGVADLEGRRVIPGLIDGHVHLTGGGGEAGAATRVPPLALSRIALGGVTTVVGVLGTDDLTRTPAGLLAAVRGLVEEGLTAYCLTGGYHVPAATITGSVRGDIVHIDRVLGVGEVAISDHRSSQPTLDEILRLASEAHVAGLMTHKAGILHLHVGDGRRGLELIRRALAESEIPPRVFNPTHVNRRKALFDEALALAVEGCTVDVTAFPVEEGEDAWSAEEAVGRYLDAGAPRERLTVSSDGGGCLPTFDEEGRVAKMDVGSPAALALTLRALLATGRPLEEVLPPFTSNPAKLLRLAAKGRLRAGGDADLVILDENHRIRDVLAGGRWFVRDGRPQVLGTFESRSQEGAS